MTRVRCLLLSQRCDAEVLDCSSHNLRADNRKYTFGEINHVTFKSGFHPLYHTSSRSWAVPVLNVVGFGLCWGGCGWSWLSRSSSFCTVSRIFCLLSSCVKWPSPLVTLESLSFPWLASSAMAVSPLFPLSSLSFPSFRLAVAVSVCLWFVTSVFFWLVTESFWMVVRGGVGFCSNVGSWVGLPGGEALSDWGALSRYCVLSSWSSAAPWLYCCG